MKGRTRETRHAGRPRYHTHANVNMRKHIERKEKHMSNKFQGALVQTALVNSTSAIVNGKNKVWRMFACRCAREFICSNL